MRREVLDQIRTRQAGVVRAVNLRTGADALLYPREPALPSPSVNAEVWAAAARALTEDRSQTVETPDGTVFLHVLNTPLRLVVVGAVHVTQPLAPMARLAGFAVTVVDPRRAFATAERLPGVEVIVEWPDVACARLGLDARTAVVTLTHDPKLDDPALAAALRSPAFYLGALGSKKTHAARLGRLREAGFSDAELARIQGPVGLDIGARSTGEVAVSILAGVIARLRAA